MRLTFEDIIFFIILGLIVFVALWLLHGSPTELGAIISVSLFVATSELFLWKKFFAIDKNTAVSFVNLNHDIQDLRRDQTTTHKKLDTIETLIRNKAH